MKWFNTNAKIPYIYLSALQFSVQTNLDSLALAFYSSEAIIYSIGL
jgi:hypothetical protein